MSTIGEVRKLAIRGAGATVLSAGITLGVQTAATLVLARLLTPADFGVVAMVTTFSLLLTNFGLNGFTEAILQRDEMTHALASNLFWINLVASAVLSLGFGTAGSLLARFYREPAVALAAVGVSVSIFLTSTSVLHLALLRRAMRFGAISANDIVARFVSVAVSIALGVAGWGYWALVAGLITLPLSQSIGAWYLCRWMPGMPRRAAGTDSMLRFAFHVYARFGVNYFARNVDNFLVGWRFGAYPLGFYKRAYDLFALPASQIASPLANVAVSTLSRFKNDSLQFHRHLLGAITLTAFIGMGMGANLTVAGRDIIRLLLGAKWGEAGRIFTFFGPGTGIMLVYYTQSWIHLSTGRAERWLRWSLLESGFTGALFLVALPWGPVGIACAWTISFWILLLPGFWYAGNPIGMRIPQFVAAIWKYVIASMVAGAATTLILRGRTNLNAMGGASGAFLRIIIASVLIWVLYLLIVVLLYRSYESIFQLAGLLKEMLPKDLWSRLDTAAPTELDKNHSSDNAEPACEVSCDRGP